MKNPIGRTTPVRRNAVATARFSIAAVLVGIAMQTSCHSKDKELPFAAIDSSAEGLRPELVALRRDIHSHPELSLGEERTANVIAEQLRALGLEVRTGVGGHGLVALLRGDLPGPVVGYRADMDALPMQEPEGRPYGSTVPGVFHGCGHDLHSAIGVGIASVLASLRHKMPGTVAFYFQPAEETLQGAAAMIADGALSDPTPDVVYAVHDWPLPVGAMAYGTVFAGVDRFTVELEGVGDEVGAQVAAGLRSLATVSLPMSASDISQALANMQDAQGPFASFVFVSVSVSSADGSSTIRGSIKASSDDAYPALRQLVRDEIERVVPSPSYRLSFAADKPFPSMASDPRVSAEAAPILARVLGADQVIALKTSWPYSGEDFALFLEQRPVAMFLLGVANAAKGLSGVPHSPTFDADEDALVLGTRAMSAVIWERLARE